MAGKKEFRITTPRGSVFTVTGKNGSTTARLEWAPGFAQKKAEGFSRAQAFVDSDQKTSETTCTARKRLWSVIPDTEGDGTDALIYKGSFKAAGEIVKGTATTTDGWKTCTFSEA